MRYNIAQLLMEPTGSTREFDLDEVVSDPEDGPDRVHGTVQVTRTHQGLLVRARLDTEARVTCSRCLAESIWASDLTLEEESFPTVDPVSGKQMSPPDEAEGVIHIDPQHVLDLSEVVRQYMLTDVPMKPLCREGCLGLCPVCGSNLNEEKCKCETASMDPRWGALSELVSERRE